MTAGDTARFNYRAARAELVERVRLRDTVLLAYLAMVGTISAVAFGQSNKGEILLAIPYLAMGASILVSQHNRVIGALLKYLSCELKPFLMEHSEYAPQFGCSKSFRQHSRSSNIYRSIAHGLIVCVPALFALAYNHDILISLSPLPNLLIWFFGLIFSIISIVIIGYAHKRRSEVYDKTEWDD
jgi:hypothetical protein